MADLKVDNMPSGLDSGEVTFDNILNLRDVGKTINEFLGEKYVSQKPTLDYHG